jgi:hypothetical protein
MIPPCLCALSSSPLYFFGPVLSLEFLGNTRSSPSSSPFSFSRLVIIYRPATRTVCRGRGSTTTPEPGTKERSVHYHSHCLLLLLLRVVFAGYWASSFSCLAAGKSCLFPAPQSLATHLTLHHKQEQPTASSSWSFSLFRKSPPAWAMNGEGVLWRASRSCPLVISARLTARFPPPRRP